MFKGEEIMSVPQVEMERDDSTDSAPTRVFEVSFATVIVVAEVAWMVALVSLATAAIVAFERGLSSFWDTFAAVYAQCCWVLGVVMAVTAVVLIARRVMKAHHRLYSY